VNQQLGFAEWATQWLAAGSFRGAHVPDESARVMELLRLWGSEIPSGWERTTDCRLLDPSRRYQRQHRHGVPRSGSEHELELEILCPDPAAIATDCLGGRLLDGINAVPLAKDTGGRRAGNVEADMLLLADGPTGPRLLLIEAKTRSNNAWYAAAESLRQLRLFTASSSAQAIMPSRRRGLPATLPVTAVVLAPPDFYRARGARRNAVAPAERLLEAMRTTYGLDARLATWDRADRTITDP
jgi:hypothetical protein